MIRQAPKQKGATAGTIVADLSLTVKRNGRESDVNGSSRHRSTRRRKRSRRQSHGSAWHWNQTDCWYYTLPGSKKRVALFDEDGSRIRGIENKKPAQLALARVKLGQGWRPEAPPASPDERVVAKVCSEYLQYCERGVASDSVSRGHRDTTKWLLNDLCRYCGALPVAELKKGHIKTWMESHAGWKSPATYRSAISVILATFNYAEENHDIPNPLKGLQKPPARPRLQSFSSEDEKALYRAVDKTLRDFLFAAIHTGLRPYCELAKITADDVEEAHRGMMWRVYSSKTKKTRKIPVRPEVAKLTHQLLKTAPRGSGIPIFRTIRGKAWSKVNGVRKLERDSQQSPAGAIACAADSYHTAELEFP